MKRFLMALSFTLFFISQAQAQTMTDREGQGLKGALKSIRVERAEVVKSGDKMVERRRFLMTVLSYDEQGYMTEELRYNPDGSLFERIAISRDGKGNRTQIFYNSDGTVKRKLIENLDERGNFKAVAEYNDKGVLQNRAVYKYGADGKLVEAAMLNPDGSLINKTIFKQDSQGKQIGYEVYNADGVLIQRSMQDSSGGSNAIYDKNGTARFEWISQQPTFELDAHGNWIKKSTPRLVTRDEQTEQILDVEYRTISYY